MALYNNSAGKPLRKIFSRFGTERSKNLADLSSTTNSLSNLLGGLSLDTGRTFIADDLNAIENIFANGLTNEGYLNVVGSAEKFYNTNGEELSFDPRITYQNRLDRVEVFSGNPRFLGGEGLTANYYQNDQILFDEHDDLLGIGTGFLYGINDVNVSGVAGGEVFGGTTADGELPSDKFWEEGDFEYSTKIHPQASKVNTGVKWEGYYIPAVTGPLSISIESTGYFTLDFQQEGYEEDDDGSIKSVGFGTYTEHMRIGISTSFDVTQFEDDSNRLTIEDIDLAKMNTIGIGMTVDGAGIAEGSIIESISKETKTIKLTPPDGSGSAITNPSLLGETTFARKLGQPVQQVIFTHILEEYEKYRIRMRYFHHQNFNSKDIVRLFNIDAREQNSPSFNNLRYNKLFPLDYNFKKEVQGTFNKYYDASVLFGGTKTTGIGDRQDIDDYVKLETTDKIVMNYVPPERFHSTDTGTGKLAEKKEIKVENSTIRNAGSKGMQVRAGSPILNFRSGSFSNDIEIGNLIVSTQNVGDGSGNNPDPNTGDTYRTFNDHGEPSIPFYARVKDIVVNNYIVMDMNALPAEGTNIGIGVTNAAIVKFVDHRGLVRRVRVNQANNSNTISRSVTTNPFRASSPDHTTVHSDVQVGMIAVGDRIPSYTRVTAIADTGESLTLSNPVTVRQGQDIFFYDSKGLRDNSLKGFCDRFSDAPTVRCLKSDIPEADSPLSDVTSFKVEDLNGVAAGWEVQGVYFGENGITISSIVDNPTDPNFKTITLASNITRALPDGAQFTAVAPAKNAGDYTLCCPPTDTSPPFVATVDGLNTTEEYKNLKIDGGNLVFESLLLQDNESNSPRNARNVGSNLSVNRTIKIKSTTQDKTYKILARVI